MGVFNNFDAISFLRGYCYSIIPLVYTDALSYMEMLAKVREKINELIKNNNQLPALITEIVEKFLESDEFEALIKSIISGGVLNVKFPPEGLAPMKGDGVTNDTAAFQAIIGYASDNDKCIFVPSGSYLLNNIVVPTGIGIYGECRNAVKFFQAGGQTGVFVTLSGENGLRNITLDCVKFNKTAEVHALSATHSSVIDCAVLNGYTGALVADGCFVQNLHCADNNEDIIISGSGNMITTDGVIVDNGIENTWRDASKLNLSNEDVVIDPTSPVTYRTPVDFNDYFKTIPAKDKEGNLYDILVKGADIGKLRETEVNVKSFGAKGDGVTDDYSSLTSALKYAKENAVGLYIPEGVYRITASLFGFDGLRLNGAGKYVTSIQMDANVNQPCVNFDNSNQLYFSNIQISNMTFDQNHAGGADVGAHGFRICGFNNLFFENCRFINASGYGLGLQAWSTNPNPERRGIQQFLTVRNCDFLNNGNNEADPADGFDCKSLKYGFIEGCYFYGNKESGLDIRGTDVVISNILARQNGINGIELRTPFSGVIQNVESLNNLTAGVSILSESGLNPSESIQIIKISNINSTGDGSALLAVNNDTANSFMKRFNIDGIIGVNPLNDGISIQNYAANAEFIVSNVKLRGRQLNAGIKNHSQGAVISNVYIDNRFLVGYNGDNGDNGTFVTLMRNLAVTPSENTSATFLYPLSV